MEINEFATKLNEFCVKNGYYMLHKGYIVTIDTGYTRDKTEKGVMLNWTDFYGNEISVFSSSYKIGDAFSIIKKEGSIFFYIDEKKIKKVEVEIVKRIDFRIDMLQ